MATGKVNTILEDRGFGFIRCDESGREIFFHMNQCLPDKNISFFQLFPGDEVEFVEVQNHRSGKVSADRVKRISP